jgi:hypothetical protein
MRRLHLALALAGLFAALLAVGASLEPVFGIGKEQLNFDVHTAMMTVRFPAPLEQSFWVGRCLLRVADSAVPEFWRRR